jgi:hypothetical protein
MYAANHALTGGHVGHDACGRPARGPDVHEHRPYLSWRVCGSRNSREWRSQCGRATNRRPPKLR